MSAKRKRKSETDLDTEYSRLNMPSTASKASKQSSDQNSSTIPEEIQDLKILDCAECFDKDAEIQALKKSNSDAYRKLKVFETNKKDFEKKIASMEILQKNLEKLNASAFKEINEQNTELLTINDDLKAAISDKNSEIESLKERIEKYHNLEAEVDSKNSTTKDLRESIREIKALREKNILSNNETEFEKTSQNSRSEVKSLRSEVKALERVNESIKNELVYAKQEVDSKNSELQDLCKTNVLSNNEIEKLKQKFKKEVDFKNNIIKVLEMSKKHTEHADNYYELSNLFKSQNTELSVIIREHSYMTSDVLRAFLTYLPTLIRYFTT